MLGRRAAVAEQVAASLADGLALPADVLDRETLETARARLLERWGRIDILVNAAGGNVAAATISQSDSVFDLPLAAWQEVLDLNLTGTLLSSQVFGSAMAERGEGCIVNVSSMAVARALTRVIAYSAAKAAVENLTRWLAVELARRHGPGLRVNALAPGFFVGEQNRTLLLRPDGGLTERGQAIVAHTPTGRFGAPDELIGPLVWLCGPGARFVNGAVIPVDGGFGAFSGI